jgi:hypothetical protein
LTKVVTVSTDPSVKDGGLAEIYQSQTTKQALLRKDSETSFTRITDFVLCRDFLVDSYSYAKAGKDFGKYGFSFKGSQKQPDWTGVYIQMRFQDAASKKQFLTHLEQIIHTIEGANGYDLTEVREIKGSDDLVAIGDKRWLQNCLSFSLYSLLLRVCCYTFDATKDWIKVFSAMDSSDSKYISSVNRKTLDTVLADLSVLNTKNFCGFDVEKENTGVIHHNSGFISVFGSHSEISPSTAKRNPHWQEMKKRGLEMHPQTARAA